MKREIASLEIAVVISELSKLIVGSWVANIYQTDFKTLIMKLHQTDRPPLNLLIEVGSRLHLTSFVLGKPARPSAFCMSLRKHLRNGRIKSIEQHQFERIAMMRIKAKREEFQLVFELFGDGNAILVDSRNRILQALSYRKMRDRNILRDETFQYPPPSGRNPNGIERKDLDAIRDYGQLEVVKALARSLGLGGFYAEEVLIRARIDKNTPCNSLSLTELDNVFNTVKELISKINAEQIKPAIIINEKNEWVDVTPFPLEKYSNFQTESCPSFNEALDKYYSQKGMEEKMNTATTETEEMLAQQKRILFKQQTTIKELQQEIEKNRKIGESIYAHFTELQLLAQKINGAKGGGSSWNDIISDLEEEKKEGKVPAVYYDSFDPQNSFLYLSINESKFPIDLRRSIQENASNYYEKAKKAQNRREGAEKALLETRQKMNAVERQGIEKVTAISKPEPRKVEKKAWYEKFRWFNSSKGFLVIGGKDAMTNEILVKKYTEPHDLVFHADISGAPFVVVKTEGREAVEQTIEEAAEFAAAFSSAWKETFAAVDVYWVRPEQVSKAPPTGQYLTKGSFMIYGKKNYLRKVQLKTTIGIVTTKEGGVKVIGGPKEAISGQTDYFVEIAPGDERSGHLAKRIRELFAQLVPGESRESVLSLSLDTIQNFIPGGKGTLLS
ncbi:MAG TPA: ribosome rescue protein RqcH [Candidatus Bathyarchaeia archaeon]|nr:ribosome rescue protein RqcH [Candidatus Bathyarchaeia archaeon]